MDPVHKITKWISYNRYTAAALSVFMGMSVWLIGCESKTAGLIDPGVKVTRAQFQREILVVQGTISARRADLKTEIEKLNQETTLLNQSVELADDDLTQQDEARQAFVVFGSGLVQSIITGTVNPMAITTSLVTLAGVLGVGGLALDNRRKDKKIKSSGQPPGLTTV